MSSPPSPERLARAWLRNLWTAYGARPIPLFFDTLKILIAALFVLGYQYGAVSAMLESRPGLGEIVLQWLPLAGLMAALFMPRLTSAKQAARSDSLRWMHSLPLALNRRKWWAVRVALYRSLVITGVIVLLLFDISLTAQGVISAAGYGFVGLALISPGIGCLLRSRLEWSDILEQRTAALPKAVPRPSGMLKILQKLSRDYLYRLLVVHSLSGRKVAQGVVIAMVLMGVAAIVGRIARIPQVLLVVGTLIAWTISMSIQPRQRPLYRISRTLPVEFRGLLSANLLWAALPLLASALVVSLCAFVAGAGSDSLAYGFGMAAVLLLNATLYTLISLAFAHKDSLDMYYTAALLILGFAVAQLSLFGLGAAFAVLIAYLIYSAHSRWTYGELTG